MIVKPSHLYNSNQQKFGFDMLIFDEYLIKAEQLDPFSYQF